MLTRRHWMQSSALLLAAASANGDVSDTWPQWRGPTRDGQFAGPAWPDTLGPDNLKLRWRVELQPSYSGPIVAGDRVFVTETRNRKTEHVTALRRADGEKLWHAEWAGALSVPFFAKENGDWIRATPALDGQTLYVGGMRDTLVAVDASTGDIRWQKDFVAELKTPLPAFGLVCSPLVAGDYLYVQAGAALLKLEKSTGKVVWRTLADGGGMWGSAFSSPVLATVHGVEQVLVQTREELAGVAPADGKVLWKQKVPSFRGMNILTPTVWKDCIFTSSYGGKSFLFKIEKEGDEWTASEMWTNKTQGYMSSPNIWGDHVYLHLKNQRFACLDLATGDEKWISKPYGKYWSTIARGERLLALDQRGELLYIKMTPEKFDLVATHKISDAETWGYLALVGNELYVRELNALAAYRWG